MVFFCVLIAKRGTKKLLFIVIFLRYITHIARLLHKPLLIKQPLRANLLWFK